MADYITQFLHGNEISALTTWLSDFLAGLDIQDLLYKVIQMIIGLIVK